MTPEEELAFWQQLSELLKKKPKKDEKKSDSGILNQALAKQRLLPGASLVRSGRPMTDLMAKIKKKLRRAVMKEYFKYRGQVVKGPQKALITGNRKTARKAYRKK